MRAVGATLVAAFATSAAAQAGIFWTQYGGKYALDVEGFTQGFPKYVELWDRTPASDGQRNLNDNEYFSMNSNNELVWSSAYDANKGKCIRTQSGNAEEGVTLQVDTCNGFQWDVVSTNYGVRLQPKGTNLCMNVRDTEGVSGGFSGQPVGLEECNNDSMQSFTGSALKPSGPPPPTPTPPPSPPPPTPTPPPSPPASDDDLVNEFYNTEIGIAVSMLSWDAINNPGSAHAINGQDRTVFLAQPDPTFHQDYQQAVSITHHGKPMVPYYGAGSPYGIALRIGSNSNFWEYFQVNQHDELCALPHDGYKCGGGIPSWRQGLVTKSWANYEWFKGAKNAVVSDTKDYTYNEFDTNGISSTALAGVFTTKYFDGIPEGDKQTWCNFFKHVPGVSQSSWPVYSYRNTENKLSITDHVSCNAANTKSTVMV